MKILNKKNVVIDKAIKFIEQLEGDIYILGTNKYGNNTAIWLQSINHKPKAFINDFIGDKTYKGYEILKLNQIPMNSSIINCIVEGRTIDAENKIVECGIRTHIDYFCLQIAFPSVLMEVNYLEETNVINEELEIYKKVYSKLNDQRSKKEFDKIVNFRLNRNIENLKGFTFRPQEQYFESFLSLNEKPAFIDGGGFDGETSRLFSELYPNYKKIYYFEPSELSYKNSKNNLIGLDRITMFKKGLWNKPEIIFFDDTLGNASKFSTDGKAEIETTTIDEIVNEKIDYIKLDLEGAEYNALLGAENTIKKYHPSIAVCVYHNQLDFIRIPKLLTSFNPDYRIYFRHYTQGVCESVMYFV